MRDAEELIKLVLVIVLFIAGVLLIGYLLEGDDIKAALARLFATISNANFFNLAGSGNISPSPGGCGSDLCTGISGGTFAGFDGNGNPLYSGKS